MKNLIHIKNPTNFLEKKILKLPIHCIIIFLKTQQPYQFAGCKKK